MEVMVAVDVASTVAVVVVVVAVVAEWVTVAVEVVVEVAVVVTTVESDAGAAHRTFQDTILVGPRVGADVDIGSDIPCDLLEHLARLVAVR